MKIRVMVTEVRTEFDATLSFDLTVVYSDASYEAIVEALRNRIVFDLVPAEDRVGS